MIRFVNTWEKAFEFIDELQHLDWSKGYKIDVSKKKHTRSIPQNKLYWLYLQCLEQETGTEKDWYHEYFNIKYLTAKFGSVRGEQIKIYPSTTQLTTAEFNQYLDKIVTWSATELNITLPDPHDKNYEHFIEYYSNYL